MKLCEPLAEARSPAETFFRVVGAYQRTRLAGGFFRGAIRIDSHAVGCVQIKITIRTAVVPFERFLGRKSRDRWREIRIGLRAILSDSRNVRFGKSSDELAIVAVCEAGPRRCIPKVKRLGLGHVARALQIGDEPPHEISNVISSHLWTK